MSKYIIDMDGTICSTPPGSNYKMATPIFENIQKANKLYDEGHVVCYHTSRGYLTGVDYTELTEMQLKAWGAKYHKLIMSRTNADYFISSRAVSLKDWE